MTLILKGHVVLRHLLLSKMILQRVITTLKALICSLQVLLPVVVESCPTLQPHELQHTRLLCPSLSPWVCSNSCPLSHWYNPTILFLAPLPLNFSNHEGFSNKSALHLRWPKYWSFSFSISPSDEYQDWLAWSPCCSRDSRVFSSTTVRKHQFLVSLPSSAW